MGRPSCFWYAGDQPRPRPRSRGAREALAARQAAHPAVEFTVGQEVYRLIAPSEAELKAELEQAGLLAATRKAG